MARSDAPGGAGELDDAEDAAIYDSERPLTLAECPRCKRRFATAESLRQHMKATKHA